MRKLPEGARVTITVYYTSEKAGINTSLSLKNMKAYPSDDQIEGLSKDHIPFLEKFADDFRPMTDDEVQEFLDEENEDYDEEGYC